MKKLFFLALILCATFAQAQYRWEFTGGITSSKLNGDLEGSNGTSVYLNAGYGYVSGIRAKTSVVFSLEYLQRTSEVGGNLLGNDLPFVDNIATEVKASQIGFLPKFRFLFGSGKDAVRPFVNVGPSLRYTFKMEIGDLELEDDQYEQLMIGGVYGAGVAFAVGEMMDIIAEAGAMNDFLDNLDNVDSKFFDIYARVGVRFRIYDPRR